MCVSSPSRASSTWKTWAGVSRARCSFQQEHPEAHFLAASPNFRWKWQRATLSTWLGGRDPRWRPPRPPRPPRPLPREVVAGGPEIAETEAVANPAESEVEAAVQARSAAAITVSKSAERLFVIAVTIVGRREHRKTRLSRSSVVALARRRWSSRPNSAGRTSPPSVVARKASNFASRGAQTSCRASCECTRTGRNREGGPRTPKVCVRSPSRVWRERNNTWWPGLSRGECRNSRPRCGTKPGARPCRKSAAEL